MPRNVFDEELARLNADLAEMGRRIDSIMQGTLRTLKNMDVALAKSIFQKDIEINTMEKSIEQSCMNLLALQQPLARDLRVITATLKVITDMERISDQCADSIREFSLYCWDQRAVGDRVVKRFDHAMDDIRYFAVSLEKGDGYIGGLSVERTGW